MEIVVDTNIIISALLREGLTRRIIFLAPFEMYTVPFAKSEIKKHRNELLDKSGDGIIVKYNSKGVVVGIEILFLSKQKAVLDVVPEEI
ncbi:hypothetical protein DRP07_08175, partial [Archaeoglobales archaeon]